VRRPHREAVIQDEAEVAPTRRKHQAQPLQDRTRKRQRQPDARPDPKEHQEQPLKLHPPLRLDDGLREEPVRRELHHDALAAMVEVEHERHEAEEAEQQKDGGDEGHNGSPQPSAVSRQPSAVSRTASEPQNVE
jgi:hypothetical protein